MQAFSFFFKAFAGPGASFMWVILIIASVAVFVVVWRAMVIARCGSGRARFLGDVAKLIKAGDISKAIRYANSSKTPLAKLFATVLQRADKGEKAMNRAVDEVFLTEGPRIQRVTPLLVTIANIATLTGLLGTIFGLILAFDAVANVPAAQRAQALATGIAIAMCTTFFGLIVAIPTLAAHGIISTQAEKLLEEMDEKGVKLINLLVEG